MTPQDLSILMLALQVAQLREQLAQLASQPAPAPSPAPSPGDLASLTTSAAGTFTLYTMPVPPAGVRHYRWIFRADLKDAAGNASWCVEFDGVWSGGAFALLGDPLWISVVGTGPGAQPPAGWDVEISTTAGLSATVTAPAGQIILWALE